MSAKHLKAGGHVLAEHVALFLGNVWKQEKNPTDWENATV